MGDADSDLIEALSELSLRSRLDAPAVAAAQGRTLSTAEDVGVLVAHTQRALFASPFSGPNDLDDGRRAEVAASVAFQSVVGQVANPVLLAHRVLAVGLSARLADVRWRIDGWGTRFGLAELRLGPVRSTEAVTSALHADVVGPLVRLWSATVAVPERILAGNAEAAIWTARAAAGDDAPFARDTCCLIHLAGMAPCDECPLSVSDAAGTGP